MFALRTQHHKHVAERLSMCSKTAQPKLVDAKKEDYLQSPPPLPPNSFPPFWFPEMCSPDVYPSFIKQET